MAIVRADQVFNAEAGFSPDELVRIGTAAAGRTISFRRVQSPESRVQSAEVAERMLTEFARGKTAEEVSKAHGMSRRRFFYVLKRSRDQGIEGSSVRRWKERGLSWREIGRLLGISHEAARQAAGETTETE